MTLELTHSLIDPIAELAQWSDQLRTISARPLAMCEDFPAIARRFEAWWAHELADRPIFIAAANTRPERPITRRVDLLDKPDAWFEAKQADMRQLHRVGDAVPFIRVDFGPVLLGALLGGQLEFSNDTSWTHAFINDDWSNLPAWRIADDNPWWLLLLKLMQRVADDAKGRYLVCTPDLGGSADVLLNLRGSTPLCMDVIERPEVVRAAVDAVYPVWRRALIELYRNTVGRGAGLIHWLAIWSDRPHIIPACDFNFMIGPREFNRICLPDIARQAATIGRALFHLDGSGAARHIDALLDVPDIQAIQFTPGTSKPSALPWIDMFRKIQQRGRSVLVICPPQEVLELCAALRPEGLAVLIERTPPPRDLDNLFAAFCKPYGGA